MITYLRVEQFFNEYLYKYHDVPYLKRPKGMESSRRRIQYRNKDRELRKTYDNSYNYEIHPNREQENTVCNQQPYDSSIKESQNNET